MKKSKIDIQTFSNKRFDGEAGNLITQFLDEASELFIKKLHQYSELRNIDEVNEHIFCYQEKQVKGHLALVLGLLCNSHFMQEPPVSRKPSGANDEKQKTGWADFWCRYGKGNKIDVLIEVKHGWSRYDTKGNRLQHYKKFKDRHKSAVTQMNRIEKLDYINDHLYSAALSVIPIYTKYTDEEDSNKDKPEKLFDDPKLLAEACKSYCAHFVYAKSTPKKINFSFEFKNDNKTWHETYPGLLLIWNVKQVHRTRKGKRE